MKAKRVYVGDFETTVYDGQTRTDVWASALTEMFTDTEEVTIDGSIQETFIRLSCIPSDVVVYYHNLKFDGAFWVDFLLNSGYQLAFYETVNEDGTKTPAYQKPNDMLPSTFKASISAMGQWYGVTIKTENNLIEIRDSLKLLPFTVERIGKAFKTKHQKLTMEYSGLRYPGCYITQEEREYIANDVLVVREALEIMFNQGHDKLTIGACCLAEFKSFYRGGSGYGAYDYFFPNIYEIPLDKEMYGAETAGEYVHKSYRGGWCYVVKGKTNLILHNGTTADVNSLYPSMMSSESGNYYPVGKPKFYKPYPKQAPYSIRQLVREYEEHESYSFLRFKTRFYLKPGKLPFIQIKNTLRYKGNESLTTSDYFDKSTGQYVKYYYRPTESGELVRTPAIVELTMTITDYILFTEHYNTEDFELLDYCVFQSEKGLFDEYMEKYKKIKQTSKGAMRELAKLFLNNLYGKMAASTDSSYKVPFIKKDGAVGFYDVQEDKKKPGYIPVGSAITSYARCFTIRAAQMNFYGEDEPGFVYADTDSIHCDLPADSIRGIRVHPTDFCAWKLESCWDEAIFVRQKTYIERVTHEDLEPIEKPYYNVKCAGMPEKCKNLFIESLSQGNTLKDFKIGLCLPGKLRPKHIPGGVLLVETTYEMR